MKTFSLTTIAAVYLFLCTNGTQAQITQTQLPNLPIESKLDWATWRTDIYICTGIAFAKSIGLTANDFAVFVGNKHSITSPDDTTISAVVKTLNMLFTTYPKGKFELLTESNLSATLKWNRPYSAYFENGPVFGVSLEEFESVLYGHAIIMTKRIGIDFKYDIKGDTIFCTLKRYR
jgi:hypothetical protein